MKVSRNWLKTYFDKDIPSADELGDLFALHSFEVEDVLTRSPLRSSTSSELWRSKADLGKSDSILDLKILPDRAHYDLSHKGIAEEISVLTKLPIKKRFAAELKSSIDAKPTVTIENPMFCRRYIARIIELGDNEAAKLSPEWLKNALESIGQRSINSIVDVTNYVMYDIGQPLHAFDADKVKGSLVIRSAKNGEKITLLDGREITLTIADNVIADDEGPLVIAGAKGGKRAEIGETTKRIIIESANFDPTMVRRTSTKYDIRSDSSKRFENEISAELAIHGMNNVSGLIQEMLPSAKFGPIVDQYPRKAKQTVIEFDPNYIEERLGVKIPLDEAKDILERMRIGVTSGRETSGDVGINWKLTIPFERLDLVIREDIVEEIGRIYGYDHVKGILPPTVPAKPILPIFAISEKIKSILTGFGYSEVSLYALVEKGDVEIAKPLAKDKAFARNNLSDGMLACVERNVLNADLIGLEAINVFEIGRVFFENSEEVHLAIGASQIKKVKGLKADNIIIETIKKLEKETGLIIKGGIHNNKAGNCSVIEIDLGSIADSSKVQWGLTDLNIQSASPNRYQKFSIFPFIVRDIAVFVPESVSSDEVWKDIQKGIEQAKSLELLTRHSLFDTFKKDVKTSYAFRLVFQSMDRTLNDEEVNKIMEAINKAMVGNKWEVR